eukprot:Awhi_evm1s15669
MNIQQTLTEQKNIIIQRDITEQQRLHRQQQQPQRQHTPRDFRTSFAPSTALKCFMEPHDTGPLYITTYPTVGLTPSRSASDSFVYNVIFSATTSRLE